LTEEEKIEDALNEDHDPRDTRYLEYSREVIMHTPKPYNHNFFEDQKPYYIGTIYSPARFDGVPRSRRIAALRRRVARESAYKRAQQDNTAQRLHLDTGGTP